MNRHSDPTGRHLVDPPPGAKRSSVLFRSIVVCPPSPSQGRPFHPYHESATTAGSGPAGADATAAQYGAQWARDPATGQFLTREGQSYVQQLAQQYPQQVQEGLRAERAVLGRRSTRTPEPRRARPEAPGGAGGQGTQRSTGQRGMQQPPQQFQQPPRQDQQMQAPPSRERSHSRCGGRGKARRAASRPDSRDSTGGNRPVVGLAAPAATFCVPSAEKRRLTRRFR